MSRVPLASLSAGQVMLSVNGDLRPAAGAAAFVYDHGTETQVPVYSIETGSTTIPQPLTADINGTLPGWVTAEQSLDIAASWGGRTGVLEAEPVVGTDIGTGGGGGVTFLTPSGGDDTAMIAAAAAAGPVQLAAATFIVDGVCDIPGASDFLGAGAGATKILCGAGGQIRVGGGGGPAGGRVGGFEIDGQGVQAVVGGCLYITNAAGGGRNSVTYQDIWVHGGFAESCRIDGSQNCDFWNIIFGNGADAVRNEVPLIFDHATGGHNLYGCEVAGGFRIQQTHTDYTGGYFTWVGPSDIHFRGGRTEYSVGTMPLVYLAGGTNISLDGFGIAGGNSLVVMEPGAQNYPLSTQAITAWDGAFKITVTDATGITALMSANVATCPPETIVVGSVVGNVVTLSTAPTADPTGGTAKFGSRALDLLVSGSNGVSGSGTSTAFDLRGAATLTIKGRPKIQNHTNAFLMRHSDQVYLQGAPSYSGVTNIAAQQQAGDTGTFNQDLRVITSVDGTLQILTRAPFHRTLFWRAGDPQAHTVITPGTVSLSDGQNNPQNTGIQYVKDTDGTEHTYILGTSARTTRQFTVLGDGASFIRGSFRGMLNAPGPPSTNNGKVGDWCIGNRGGVFVLVTSGTPDTWINASAVRPQETITIDPLLAGTDAQLKTGTWTPNLDTAAIGNGWLYNSSNAQNDEIGFSVDLTQGTWTLALMYRKQSSEAIATVNLDGASVGTLDQYAAAQQNNSSNSIAGISVATSGSHTLSFKAATRNAAATGWFLTLQKIQLRRTA